MGGRRLFPRTAAWLSWPQQRRPHCACSLHHSLIFVASYTASLAAALTATAVASGVQKIGDLAGLNVAAHTV